MAAWRMGLFHGYAIAVLLAGCSGGASSDNRSEIVGSSVGGVSGSGASAGAPSESGPGGIGGFEGFVEVGGSPGAAAATGNPEVCDGTDNDGNGIIDDVDVGGDGVCDCLNIATIGEIGPWSNGGNLFEAWLDSRSPRGAVALGDQTLTDEVLEGLHVVVVLYSATSPLDVNGRQLAPHHEFSPGEAAAFTHWVEDGGGVMTTIGYTVEEASEVANVNRLLEPLGMGYSTTELDLDGYIESWVGHPITDGVSRIYADNGVEPSGSGMVLARDSSNRVALEVTQAGNGRVVVWGDEWITYDSEWQDLEEQQVELFWLNILKWLSPPRECQVDIPDQIR